MPKNPLPEESKLQSPYPDPLQKGRNRSMADRLADVALVGDQPTSRLFSSLPTAIEQRLWDQLRQEREEQQ